MRTPMHSSLSIPHERAWWAVAAAFSAIVGIAASFQLPATLALAPELGAAGAHLILAAIYGLAALVVLGVLRSTAS